MIYFVWLIPFVALLVYSVFSAFKYTRMISNIFMGLVYKPSGLPNSAVRGEKISIWVSSDKEIEALVVEKKNPRCTVIFCHESGATKESWEIYMSFLPEAGCRVLSVDFDEKTGEEEVNAFTQWPEERDVERLLTVIRWMKKAYETSPIVLFGVSKGANIALATSFRSAEVRAVVTDGLFSMKEIFRDYIRKWAPVLVKPNLFGENYPDWVVNIFTQLGFWHCERRSGKKFIDVEKLLKRKHIPLLMIHGENDDYVPSRHQKFLKRLETAGELKTHLVIPKAGHNEAVKLKRDLYEKEVMNFFTGVLKK